MAMLSLMEMIEEAYERIGVDPRAGYDYRTARRSLNIILSDWSNRGLNLWSIQQQTYPVGAGVQDISLDPSVFDLIDAAFRDTSTAQPFDLNLDRMSPSDFLSIPYKQMPGIPTRYLVRRGTGILTVTLWQVPHRSGELVVNQLRVSDELTGYSSPIQIPERFQNALISGLAYNLALKRAPARVEMMKVLYEQDFQIAADEDRDRSSFMFIPEVTR